MTVYDYVIARFIPDFVKDEPVNVGVLVHEKETSEIIGKFIQNYSELKLRNPDVNVNALDKILEGYRGKHKIDSEDYLFRLVKDCKHSLHFKNVCAKNALTPELASEQLFKEYISISPKEISA